MQGIIPDVKVIKLAEVPAEKAIAEAIKVLTEGGLIIFPTETVYGAGVDATQTAAVAKLLAYKTRREGKPLSIAVTGQEMAAKYVDLNEQAKKLYQRFLPGPVTVVSQGKGKVAAGVQSEFGTLGVRVPDYELALKLIEQYGRPLTATSANASGRKRPYSINDILTGISAKQKSLIDLVLDAGELPKNEPSTVIDTTLSTPTTLRAGSVQLSAGEEATTTLNSASEAETKKIAGTLLLKNWTEIKERGLVIGLDGALGTGKTIFAKGVAEFLQITDEITSPTYSYIEEYQFKRHGVTGQLYHLDLWKIESAAEVERLEIEGLLRPNSVVIIEWWQPVAAYLLTLVAAQHPQLLHVLFTELDEHSRQLSITEPSINIPTSAP